MFKQAVKVIVISSIVALSYMPTVKAEQAITPTKRALIKELLTITNADKTSNQIWDAMLSQMEANLPTMISQMMKDQPSLQGQEQQQKVSELSQRIFKRYKELLQQRINMAEIVEQVNYPIFNKYYTENELKDLIAFYKTPTGKKAISVMPQIASESMQLSNQLIMPKMMELMQDMQKIIREETNKL